MTDSPPLLLTIAQAARQLAVNARTVRRLLDRGDLPSVRIGRAVRIASASLSAYVDSAITARHTDQTAAAPETDPCQKTRNVIKMASTSARGHRSGGPRPRTDAGAQLVALLESGSTKTRKG